MESTPRFLLQPFAVIYPRWCKETVWTKMTVYEHKCTPVSWLRNWTQHADPRQCVFRQQANRSAFVVSCFTGWEILRCDRTENILRSADEASRLFKAGNDFIDAHLGLSAMSFRQGVPSCTILLWRNFVSFPDGMALVVQVEMKECSIHFDKLIWSAK